MTLLEAVFTLLMLHWLWRGVRALPHALPQWLARGAWRGRRAAL